MNSQFSIGDVDKGFDIERMVSIAAEFSGLIKETCGECRARFLCRRCYIHFAREGRFEIDPEFCDKQRNFAAKLELLIKISAVRGLESL
ncbi:MAG: hypothetical protein GY765_00450 [bacterium]|nr:hypothetical protein [bacterium]